MEGYFSSLLRESVKKVRIEAVILSCGKGRARCGGDVERLVVDGYPIGTEVGYRFQGQPLVFLVPGHAFFHVGVSCADTARGRWAVAGGEFTACGVECPREL